MSTPLVLASASPARLATLRAAGVAPQVVVSAVDEVAVLAAARARFGELAPAEAVLLLAQAKAEDVARTLSKAGAGDVPAAHAATNLGSVSEQIEEYLAALADGVVLGCDSMLELDGVGYGRPATAAQAIERWRLMRGRTGTLHTGHWLIDLRDRESSGTGATIGATASTVVHFADLDDEEVVAYVATGEPLQVAGAFTVDALGGPYIEGVEGDHHNVVGVSLPLVRRLLAQLNLAWHELRT